VLQILAIGLVWLAVMAVRFGPAREVVQRRRRSPLEHLEALGAGLESAQDESTAVRRLVAGLQRRLSVSRGGDTETWLEALELAMRRPEGRAAVRRLRHLLRERGGTDGSLVLATAQAVEDVWEELRPRTTREQY
jgi:ABC-type transport system involved in cytochrome c biogenesis ATPase subunit